MFVRAAAAINHLSIFRDNPYRSLKCIEISDEVNFLFNKNGNCKLSTSLLVQLVWYLSLKDSDAGLTSVIRFIARVSLAWSLPTSFIVQIKPNCSTSSFSTYNIQFSPNLPCFGKAKLWAGLLRLSLKCWSTASPTSPDYTKYGVCLSRSESGGILSSTACISRD